MRGYICLIIFVLFSFLSNGQEIIKYDSLSRDSCKIKLVKGDLFYWQCYNYFGKLSKVGNCYGEKKTGSWKIYDHGKLLKEGEYKNDFKNGIWKEYFLDGSEVYIGKYKNDKKNGIWRIYYSEKNDLRNFKKVDESFLRKSFTYKDGDFNGTYIECFSNGQIKIKGKYKKGKKIGCWISYDLDGNIIQRENYNEAK